MSARARVCAYYPTGSSNLNSMRVNIIYLPVLLAVDFDNQEKLIISIISFNLIILSITVMKSFYYHPILENLISAPHTCVCVTV